MIQFCEKEVYYCHNFLVYPRFEYIFNLAKDFVYHEIKLIMARIEIKLLIDNIIFKTIKQFSLNNIDTIFHKYVGFTWSLIGIIANLKMVNKSVPNSPDNHPALINIETNIVMDSNLNNFSSNKDGCFFNKCIFSFNHNHHKDNLNIDSNGKFDISLIVLIKKRT